MLLEGSCHCGAVTFSVEAQSPVPFMRCYCSICRKTAGSGGYAINLGADAGTLRVSGQDAVSVYRAKLHEKGRPAVSSGQRHFCRHCGSPLWLWDPQWPELVHPHAGAIDTPLPVPPQSVHILLDSKANWVEAEGGRDDERHDRFPSFSLAEWHEQHGFGPKERPKSTPRRK